MDTLYAVKLNTKKLYVTTDVQITRFVCVCVCVCVCVSRNKQQLLFPHTELTHIFFITAVRLLRGTHLILQVWL